MSLGVSTNSPLVSVVICTKGRHQDLAECLHGLKGQVESAYEVIVVDGEGDNSVRELVSSFGYIYIDQTKEKSRMNTPAARNLGINRAGGDVIAFVDDDAVPSRSWLNRLLRHYAGDDAAGVGGMAIVSSNSTRSNRDIYGVGLVRAVFLALLGEDTSGCGRVLQSGLVTENWANAAQGAIRVESLIGTNMSFSRKWLQKVGPFDEFVSTYGVRDETDLCLRVIENGGMLLYEPQAVVYHKLSPKRSSSIRMYYKYYTDFYFLMKHKHFFSLPRFLVREVLEFAYLVGRSAFDVSSNQGWRHALRGRVDAYIQFGLGSQRTYLS